jgi:hypothetical protein
MMPPRRRYKAGAGKIGKTATDVAAGILPAVEPWLPARRQTTSAIHPAPDIL